MLAILQIVTYLMALHRWFTTDLHGFTELIWAIIPVINFIYVGDMWLRFLGWIWDMAIFVLGWILLFFVGLVSLLISLLG